MRPKRHHITIDVPEDVKFDMKLAALQRHMTMRSWLIAIIAEAIRKQKDLMGIK